jgi:hypothetical protein
MHNRRQGTSASLPACLCAALCAVTAGTWWATAMHCPPRATCRAAAPHVPVQLLGVTAFLSPEGLRPCVQVLDLASLSWPLYNSRLSIERALQQHWVLVFWQDGWRMCHAEAVVHLLLCG